MTSEATCTYTKLTQLYTERQMLLSQHQNLNKLIPPYRDPAHADRLASLRRKKDEIVAQLEKLYVYIAELEDLRDDEDFAFILNNPYSYAPW